MRRTPLFVAGLAVLALAADPPAASAPFFDGKTTAGWEGLPEYWSVKDGAIVGSTAPGGAKFNTFLCSTRKYKDFELSFQVRLKDGGGNSGVQIRSEVVDKAKFVVKGPQADIAKGYWGSLYGEKMPEGMLRAANSAEVNKVLKPADFNSYSVKCVGQHVTIKVNDLTTVDQDFPALPAEGIIAWQLHQGPAMEVTFKDIVFKELK
jgi:Domain of Unknown Function (DUF1080)